MPAFTTTTEQETEGLGKALGERLQAGDVIAFRGGLGAGKTAFTRGIAAGLGAADAVSSPTFAIANVYRGGRLTLAHFDMYRIHDMQSLEDTGFYDYIADGQTAYAIEWSENIAAALPDSAVTVTIERLDDTTRRIVIEGDRQAGRPQTDEEGDGQ